MSKRILYLCMACSLVFVQCSDSSSDPETPPVDENLPLWSDDFNGSSLDSSKWSYETGTGLNGNWGTGQIDRATNRAKNVSIQTGISGADGGCLVITTRKERLIDRNYTSGRINTASKASFGPGHRIQARVWAKDVRYKGQGFAFWMMPDEKYNGTASLMWPQGGEVDIMEYVGSIPYHNLGTVHYAWWWKNNQWYDGNHGQKGYYYSYEQTQAPATKPQQENYPPPENNTYTGSYGFHIYGLDWYEDRMEFTVDGVVYHIHYFNDGTAFDNGLTDEQDEDNEKALTPINGKRVYKSEYSNHFPEWRPFEHKMYLILSAGVGGSSTTYGGAITSDAVFPCEVYIEWVKVYKL
ncbi:MAG TPA: glycoside hydrolase family 16 protein [Ignavibacteriales bacterium]|nr:glycoside hydrolase family 16 protein [Ignavibacteriales bacterium]